MDSAGRAVCTAEYMNIQILQVKLVMGSEEKRDFLSSWLCKSAMGDHDFILSIPARSRAKEHKAVCKYKSKLCWAMKDKLQLSIAVQLSIFIVLM